MKDNVWSRFRMVSSVIGMIGLSVLLSGCGVELTDEQNRIIAEYAADLLLEYDAEYQAKYGNTESDTSTDEATEASEDHIDTEATEQPEVTEMTEEPDSSEESSDATTESVTTEESIIDITEEKTEDEAQTTTEAATQAASTTEEVSDVPPLSNDNVTDIAEIVGISGLSITYSKCMFLDRYPSIDQDGAFIYLDADPGYKLAVIKFDIVNHTSESIMLDLLNTDIDYRLVMNRTKAAKPMLTILMDDLGTFSNSIPGNNDQGAVLVFQISENSIEQIQGLDLKVMYSKKEYVIHIQ